MKADLLSRRVGEIKPPASIAMAQRARDMRAAGIEVLDFSTGEPDFDTPGHIKMAAVKALNSGYTHYAPSKGYPELLSAIADRFQRLYGDRPNPSTEIIVTPGAKQAILTVLLTILNEGDEILLPSPCWVSYAEMTAMAGGKPVYVVGEELDGFIPSLVKIRDAITSRTKAVVINNPCNPTGSIWSRGMLEGVRDLAVERDLVIISDEIYDELIFSTDSFVSFRQLAGVEDRTVIINGWSKTYAMTGWRIGYLIGPASLVSSALPMHQNSATSVASFVQMAAMEALQGPQDCIREMRDEYRARRDLLIGGLNGIRGMSCSKVDATFYAFVNIQGLGMSSEQAAEFLLNEAGVVTVPGTAYGMGGEGYLRFSFAVSRETILRALHQLGSALGKKES
ncbi:MAG: pyridoxal phosphate-dependent aminotransferase [Verrucomicrobia bacterium]|nr:pyridoxal phosphate-dependent aminotransferase [Verrucomicrobiota bacterium]